jgi:hypothetical protein
MANSQVSRRKLIAGASAGAAAVGVLAGIPLGELLAHRTQSGNVPAGTGPLMVYAVDPAKAEFVLLVGTQKYTFNDPALVQRLLQVAH